MTTSEDKIIEALKRTEDQTSNVDTLHQVVSDMTQNQSIFLGVFPWLAVLATLAVAIFAVVQFFATDDPKQWLMYATLLVCDFIIMAIIKLWFYLCWVRNSILRDIKRAELRLLIAKDGTPRSQ